MQRMAEGIIREINRKVKHYNILTFPTHPAYQSNWSLMPHTFYMISGPGILKWNNKNRLLPKNHIILDNITNNIKFDIILSQNKFGQFQVADQLARQLNLPHINIEHTLPVPQWGRKRRLELTNMRGKINVFISDHSVGEWGFNKTDADVRVVHHAINTSIFNNDNANHDDGHITTVVNDYINRDIFCGYNIYKEVCLDNKLPVKPLGDTPGLSLPTKSIDELVTHLKNANVFFNTSLISPVPTALLEAMACGCAVVTTGTCMIPSFMIDGYNGFMTNDKQEMKNKLEFLLKNKDEARRLGINARKTIIEKFNLDKHISNFMQIFDEVVGTGY